MEQTNLPVVTKRVWKLVRVMFFILRKGISKGKLMVDLNMMMKRGKIAGKAIHNLMFHHHTASSSSSKRRSHDGHASFAGPHEYEFSCSNSPAFPFHLITKRNKHNSHNHFFACAHAPATEDDAVTVNAVKKALEMLNSEAGAGFWQSPAVRDLIYSELSSPALPGFGRTPAVRQLRITDSPFPLRDVDEDSHVDKAAEAFIDKFYKDLRKQNRMAL
ncbi:Early growth response protein like [Actinidia chinensis var. chinensis]|uniref:Early growth response protein like n=1 Tax=Actinidia chinensis var. chinensis TaxID=1590841 RepID=A0A2R6QFK3_ACTCC|nr:Early growth response protein like [Actinidia chinensis var. chinensis]